MFRCRPPATAPAARMCASDRVRTPHTTRHARDDDDDGRGHDRDDGDHASALCGLTTTLPA